MSGTKDNIIELIEYIEKDHHNYVIGIIKKIPNDNQEKIEIYTNLGDNPLEKLLKTLKEYKRLSQSKIKNSNIIEIEKKDIKE
jgi:hypothetical protein